MILLIKTLTKLIKSKAVTFVLFVTERLGILVLSIVLSLASLVKTGVNVNQPDPDANRVSPQNVEQAPRFIWTSILFHLFCILFRLSCMSFFFATLRHYTVVILIITITINLVLLYLNSKSNYVVIILLGVVSIFIPNGYLVRLMWHYHTL